MNYQKLPGHRRGFVKGSSLWLGDDHLLLVKSTRVREEYKRFLLRDIQAIVTASMPRFIFSTPMLGITVLWTIAYFALRNRAAWAPATLWIVAAALVCIWLFQSLGYSCTCRIYTAVSRDDLPSLYRTWTVRRFLAEIEPRIAQAQGVLESDWAQAVETRDIGPPLVASIYGTTGAAVPATAERNRTTATDLFVASLFAHALYIVLTLHAVSGAALWMGYALAGLQFAIAVAIFMQYRRGTLRAAMPKLAIAALLAVGGSYYARQIIYSFATASSVNNSVMPDPKVLAAQPAYILLRQADAAVALVLGIAGVILSFVTPRGPAPRTIAG